MFLLLLQYLFVTVTASVIFEDCGSAYDLHKVNINGCDRRLPCHITLGDRVPVTMHFISDFESRKLDQDVVLNINFISLRTYATPDLMIVVETGNCRIITGIKATYFINSDIFLEPCATVHCPVTSDAVTSFTSVLTVPTNVAVNQRGFLQWKVYNDEDRLVLCYSVLVQTQTRLQKFLRSFNIKQRDILPEEINDFGSNLNETDTDNIFIEKLSRSRY